MLDWLAALLRDTIRQNLCRDAFNRLFACGVDVEQKQRVCVSKRCGELFHQIASAGVAVRLENDVNLAKAALLRRSQSSFDFGGMVPVIVDDADAHCPPPQLKSAINASELIERRADCVDANVESKPYRNRGGRIQDIVCSRHKQRELAKVALLIGN